MHSWVMAVYKAVLILASIQLIRMLYFFATN